MALCLGLPGWASTRRNIHPHTSPDHQPFFISFLHLLWSIAYSLFSSCAWQSFCSTSLQVPFGLLLGLEPSTFYSIHFFTQSLSSFHNTCQYHCSLYFELCLFFTLTSYIHLTILISARWSATSFSFLTGQVSLHAKYYFAHNCCTVSLS